MIYGPHFHRWNLPSLPDTNLGDQVVSHQSDQQSLDKFKVGLSIAKRARQLALNLVVPALAARPAASRSKTRKEKQSRRRREP
jgi:hypothetical protein